MTVTFPVTALRHGMACLLYSKAGQGWGQDSSSMAVAGLHLLLFQDSNMACGDSLWQHPTSYEHLWGLGLLVSLRDTWAFLAFRGLQHSGEQATGMSEAWELGMWHFGGENCMTYQGPSIFQYIFMELGTLLGWWHVPK